MLGICVVTGLCQQPRPVYDVLRGSAGVTTLLRALRRTLDGAEGLLGARGAASSAPARGVLLRAYAALEQLDLL